MNPHNFLSTGLGRVQHMSWHEQESSPAGKRLLQSLGKDERLKNQTSKAALCTLDSRAGWTLLFTASSGAREAPDSNGSDLCFETEQLPFAPSTRGVVLQRQHLPRSSRSASLSKKSFQSWCPERGFAQPVQAASLHEDPVGWEHVEFPPTPVPELRGDLGAELCLSLCLCWRWQRQRTSPRRLGCHGASLPAPGSAMCRGTSGT